MEFRLVFHGDTVFEAEGVGLNMGYNYTLGLPVMLWLHHLQSGQGDIFERTGEIHEKTQGLMEILKAENIRDPRELAKELPMSESEFNLEAGFYSGFCDGSNRRRFTIAHNAPYTLEIREGFEDGLVLLSLQPTKVEEMLKAYSRFLHETAVLQRYVPMYEGIAAELRLFNQ